MGVDSSDVTIVVPTKDDPQILACLASLPENVPCVISCNGSTPAYLLEVREIARRRRNTTVVSLPAAGIAAAYNHGIDHSNTAWVLLIDSDCVLVSSLEHILSGSIDPNILWKGKVLFREDGVDSHIAAHSRRICEDPDITGRVNAYSPPLLYHKAIVQRMGGFHFHPSLNWREDREFELRRRRFGVDVARLVGLEIAHAPMSLRSDLRSLKAYGRGQKIGELETVFEPMILAHELRKAVRNVRRGLASGHLACAFYSGARPLITFLVSRVSPRRREANVNV